MTTRNDGATAAATDAGAGSLGLDRFERVALCHRDTPIEPLPRLSAALGGPALFVKRDDCTGLAGGGNKTRKLEFLVGDALAQGADMLVTQGAVQSNHVRQTAAAAAKVGIDCHALLERRVPDRAPDYERTGNVLLDRLFGASLEFRGPGLDMNAEAQAVVATLRAEGRRPYFIPGGGSNPIGALGYAGCAEEIVAAQHERGERFDHLVMATGSTGTQAGLVAGFAALDAPLPVMGISVRQPHERQVNAVHALTCATLDTLGAAHVERDRILVDDGYVGAGYGQMAESTHEAIGMLARLEGLLLDPVYSAKGMAGLIGQIRAGAFGANERILFLHTGGATALFAYEDALASD